MVNSSCNFQNSNSTQASEVDSNELSKPDDPPLAKRAQFSLKSESLLRLTSALLSIVLSHHYQKEEIHKLIQNTPVDFAQVRDTMYKYSKKAEEKFNSSPHLAFLFVAFSHCSKGKAYTKHKLLQSKKEAKKGEPDPLKASDHPESDDQNQGSRPVSHQALMSERIISEIDSMSSACK